MTTIDVRPAKRSGLYTATLEGRDICTSRQPFLDAARVLLAEGLDPDTALVMRWPTGTESLRSTIGYAAKLTVEDGPDGRPRFRLHRHNPWAGGSHIAPIEGAFLPGPAEQSNAPTETT